MNKHRKKIIRYIYQYVNDCDKETKIDILNQIAIKYSSDIIFESNDGCNILFEELEDIILKEIKKIIYIDLSKHLICFKNIEKV